MANESLPGTLIEAFEEKSSLVAEDLRFDNKNIGDIGANYFHDNLSWYMVW